MCCDGSRPTLRLGQQDSQRRRGARRGRLRCISMPSQYAASSRPVVPMSSATTLSLPRPHVGAGTSPSVSRPQSGRGRVPSPHGSVPGDRPAAESAGFAASCRMPRATSSTGLPHYPPAASADPFRPDTTRGQPHPQPRACVRRTGQAQVDTVWSRDQRPCRHGNPHPAPRSA